MRRWLIALLLLAACTTTTRSQTCAERADEAYRMCQQAPFQPLGEPETEMLNKSDEQQMCRARYHQAMAQCSESTIKVKTSTISPIPTLQED